MNYEALDKALEYLNEAKIVKQYYDSSYYITNAKIESVPVAVYKYKEDAEKIDIALNAIKKSINDIKVAAANDIFRYMTKHSMADKLKNFKTADDLAKKLKISGDNIRFYYEIKQSGLAYGSFDIGLDISSKLPIHYIKECVFDYATKELDYSKYSIMDGDKYSTY